MHALIVGAFLLFLVFAAEPLFNRLERIAGESQLHSIALPPETDNLRYWFGTMISGSVVEFTGWAFIQEESPDDSQCYLVLQSSVAMYVFDTAKRSLPTLNEILQMEEPDVTQAGFLAVIPLRYIDNGVYRLGIYMTRGETEALQYTESVLTKTDEGVEVE